MRIDSSGRVLIGNSTAAGVAGLQLWGIDAAAQQHIRRYSNDAAGASINLFKGRGDATTSAIVQNGDSLGYIGFSGHDGSSTLPTATIITARIEAVVDGVPGTNDMPSRLVFSTTPDGSATITERMRINSSGNVLIGTTTDDTTSKLQVTGTVKATAFIGDATGLTYTGASVRPSLLLDFANSKFLDQGITFTRSSAATYIGYDGLLKIAASSEPRFDHDPITGESLGLLIEEQRTNLFTYSENFDNAAWVKGNSTIIANAAIAPDGTLTADKHTEDTNNSAHSLVYVFSAVSGNTYTASYYMKSGERTEILIGFDPSLGFSTYQYGRFNLVTGVATTFLGSPILSITAVGNGWYRCSVTATATGTGNNAQVSTQIHNGATNVYTGNGTSGLYIWGAQLEQGAFPTSYTPSADSFTSRASTGTFIGSDGLVKTAAINTARYNYNPMNLKLAPKLLLEPAATNLLTYSEQFDNVIWEHGVGGNLGISVTADNTTSPDGTTNADKITNDAGATSLFQYDLTVTASSTNDYTASIFVKAGTATKFVLNCYYVSNAEDNILFDLTTGTYVSGATAANQASIIAMGNGWYRVSFVLTRDATGTRTAMVFRGWGMAGTVRGNGVIGEYYYAWGAQLEVGTTATSYIPTTSAQVTRSADVSSSSAATRPADNAVITGTNFSSWYRQDEGTLALTAKIPVALGANEFGQLAQLDNTIVGTRLCLFVNPYKSTGLYFENNYVIQADAYKQYTESLTTRQAIGYKANDIAYSNGNDIIYTDTSATIPTFTNLKIGMGTYNNIVGVRTISKLAYYPKRLSNAELQSITTG
jgi:hypothetical protein